MCPGEHSSLMILQNPQGPEGKTYNNSGPPICATTTTTTSHNLPYLLQLNDPTITAHSLCVCACTCVCVVRGRA